MRIKQMWMLIVVIAAMLVEGVALAQTPPRGETAVSNSPAAAFIERAFEFPPVVDGVKVMHDFVVVNKGKAPLLIDNVLTG